MKRVLWVSQHDVQPIQLPALRRMFGLDVVVVKDPRPFNSAEEILARYRQGRFDDMVVVAPLWVITHLVKLGLKPLWSETPVVNDQRQADFTFRGRYYRFTGFRRILDIKIEFADEGPEAERRPDD